MKLHVSLKTEFIYLFFFSEYKRRLPFSFDSKHSKIEGSRTTDNN